ncbi:MAG: fused MFS/spermidine synthase [Nitrospina sp.]|mgnify:FL=1|jgi:spermidine synthase|nr:fused MFS/spermidine synthase [Nitrospina sp.]
MSIFSQKKKESEVKILVQEKSDYNDIYVMQKGSKREMWFRKKNDFFLQSRIDINKLDTLILVNTKLLISALLLQPAPRSILMIGLGGCAVSNFLSRLYPQAIIDVVEIDQKVIDISKKFFYLNETLNYKVHHDDGRRFVRKMLERKTYDLIYLDAFKSGSVPFHLKTIQFYKDVNRVLSSGGVVGSNLYGKSNLLKPNDWKTFSGEFNRIYCFEDHDRRATVLFATNRVETWGMSHFIKAAKQFPLSLPFSLVDMAKTYRAEKLEKDNGTVFEDDFTKDEFDRTIEKNNLDRTKSILYPIKNFE